MARQAAPLLALLALLPALVDGGSAAQEPDWSWRLLAKQDVRQKLFDTQAGTTFLQDADDPSSDAYMVIGRVRESDPRIRVDGRYRFKLIYDSSTTLEWSQTSWLTRGSITGFQCIAPADCGPSAAPAHRRFRGLARSRAGSWAVLDGDGQAHAEWWNSVGTLRAYQHGIPAWNQGTAHTMHLFVKELREAEAPGPEAPGPKPATSALPPPSAFTATTTTTEHYDCAEGRAHWDLGWSPRKKEWCCQRAAIGCTSITSTSTATSATMTPTLTSTTLTSTITTGKSTPGTTTTVTATIAFDCSDGVDTWELGWSAAKKLWCCEHHSIGCDFQARGPTTSSPVFFSCYQDTRVEVWTPMQRSYCCEHERVGCPEMVQNLEFVNTDGEQVKLQLSKCGFLSYFVGEDKVLNHVWSVTVEDRLTLHLKGFPVGNHTDHHVMSLQEKYSEFVDAIMDLFRQRTRAEPVYVFFSKRGNSFSYHMGEPWQEAEEIRLDIQFYAFREEVHGTQPIYDFYNPQTNKHTYHFGDPEPGEQKGQAVFYAFPSNASCLEPVFDFWRPEKNETSLHMGAAHDGETRMCLVFYAYPPPGDDGRGGAQGSVSLSDAAVGALPTPGSVRSTAGLVVMAVCLALAGAAMLRATARSLPRRHARAQMPLLHQALHWAGAGPVAESDAAAASDGWAELGFLGYTDHAEQPVGEEDVGLWAPAGAQPGVLQR